MDLIWTGNILVMQDLAFVINNFDILVCWQVNCSLGHQEEKEGFAALIKELHAAMKPKGRNTFSILVKKHFALLPGLILSAAVSPSKEVIDEAYDVTVMDQYLDHVSVMTYGNLDDIENEEAIPSSRLSWTVGPSDGTRRTLVSTSR